MADHPRSRGEYISRRLILHRCCGSSPLSRGIPVAAQCCSRSLRIIPALAGNTDQLPRRRGLHMDHPRSRGEYPASRRPCDLGEGSSPLSRGILATGKGWAQQGGIIPALAGNTRHHGRRPNRAGDHPRSRGEYEFRGGTVHSEGGSSPLSRGILLHRFWPVPEHGIIPALAGNTSFLSEEQLDEPDHPRSRGEYPRLCWLSASSWGSSPLSRGIPALPRGREVGRGIIPALAGNTPCASRVRRPSTDHPRSRGEYAPLGTWVTMRTGSSPLSRGILERRRAVLKRLRIIPALAGNTRLPATRPGWLRDHPRSRGEYHGWCRGVRHCRGSSPLSRGILQLMGCQLFEDRIIPALAGNTILRLTRAVMVWDHPRSRGEYKVDREVKLVRDGSSPLSRGIHARRAPPPSQDRIIPALAGNTSRQG